MPAPRAVPVLRAAAGFGAGFTRFARYEQDFLSPSEQDQAILRYRVGRCMAASVVRDRLIANGSGSGDPALQSGVCMAVGETSRSRCAFGETDGGEGQALALRYKGGCCGPVARGPVPRARRGGARQAPVVRDRLIANRSRSGDLNLQRGL